MSVVVLGDKNKRPYMEEKLKGRFVVYDHDNVTRGATEMEEILGLLLIEARKPLSKTQFRDACTLCGDTKQKQIDGYKQEASKLRRIAEEAQIKYEKLRREVSAVGAKGVQDGSKENNGPCESC